MAVTQKTVMQCLHFFPSNRFYFFLPLPLFMPRNVKLWPANHPQLKLTRRQRVIYSALLDGVITPKEWKHIRSQYATKTVHGRRQTKSHRRAKQKR